MKLDIINGLLIVSVLGLNTSGLIYLCLNMFVEHSSMNLNIALGCIVLANLFNFVRNKLCSSAA